MNIGADIVDEATEPTKTVEEMQELMGVETATETEGEQASASVSDSSTTVKVDQPDLSSAFVIGDAPQTSSQPEPSDDVFDPAIHCVDEMGNPRKTKTGKYRRKPGRKGETAKEQVKATKYESFTCAAPVSTVHMVQMMIDSVTLTTAKVLGDKWKPSNDEKAVLTDAYARYIHYKGWDSAMSPEAFIIGVTASYLLPRLIESGFFEKLLGMGKKDAHPNSRQNGVGQNNAGKSYSPPVGTSGNAGNHSRPVNVERLGGTIEISSLNR